MNKLKAFFAKNHKAVLAAGGIGAVGLGLYARNKKKTGGPVLGSVQPARTTMAPATYDSTSSDLYNSIEPLIEGLQRQITALGQTTSTPATSTTPTIVTTPTVITTPTVPAAPAVPQTVMSAPAIIGVAPPPPDPTSPGIIWRIPNPITGETGTLAVGSGPYPFIYGGTEEQVNQILDPALPGGTWNAWDDPKYSWK